MEIGDEEVVAAAVEGAAKEARREVVGGKAVGVVIGVRTAVGAMVAATAVAAVVIGVAVEVVVVGAAVEVVAAEDHVKRRVQTRGREGGVEIGQQSRRAANIRILLRSTVLCL